MRGVAWDVAAVGAAFGLLFVGQYFWENANTLANLRESLRRQSTDRPVMVADYGPQEAHDDSSVVDRGQVNGREQSGERRDVPAKRMMPSQGTETARQMLQTRFAALFSELNLEPEERAAFNDLLGGEDSPLAHLDLAEKKLARGSPGADGLVKGAMREIEGRLQREFGPEMADHVASEISQRNLRKVAAKIGLLTALGENPLSLDQSRRLMTAMVEAGPAGSEGRQPIQLTDIDWSRVRAGAKTFLTLGQLRALSAVSSRAEFEAMTKNLAGVSGGDYLPVR